MLLTVHTHSFSKSLLPSLIPLLLALLFAGLLSLAFLDNKYYYLAWVAFIPLLIAGEKLSSIKLYIVSLFGGFTFFASTTYWIVDFIVISKGHNVTISILLACIYWLYCAHLIVLLLTLFYWLKRHTKIHEYILFPLIVAVLTSAYPLIFSVRLGESQVGFPIALQAIEFFGVQSLDAIIALCNVVFFRLVYSLYAKKALTVNDINSSLLVAVFFIFIWFAYGFFSYAVWEEKVAQWNTVKMGIVQPNEIPKIGRKAVYPGYSHTYPPEMAMTERLSYLGAEVIVWPEAQDKQYFEHVNIRNSYQTTMKNLDSSLIFQDMKKIKAPRNGELQAQYNMAVMLNNNGQQVATYQKIERIPFGEYNPVAASHFLSEILIEDFFGDFSSELSQGTKHEIFKHHQMNIIPLICYETTFPQFVGQAVKAVKSQRDKTLGSILLGLSNDGWFGSTHQPYQHIMASVLRAVENRLPLVHVANNGPSIVVSPSGHIIFTTDFQKAGGYIVDVPQSNSAYGSFFSQYPNLFIYCLYTLLLFIIIGTLISVFVHPLWLSFKYLRK